MNLLLLRDSDFLPDGTVQLTGRRAQHAREVLRAEPGETLRVGRLGGLVGTGEVLENTPGLLRLRVTLTEPPPPRAGVDLLLAIPAPRPLSGDRKIDPLGDSNSDPTPPAVRPLASRSQPTAPWRGCCPGARSDSRKRA